MPMDGLTLGFATREMNAILPGGRIDRITQPEKDTIVLLVRAERRIIGCCCARRRTMRAATSRI